MQIDVDKITHPKSEASLHNDQEKYFVFEKISTCNLKTLQTPGHGLFNF